ncbi:MAG TPA: ABC transporter ATP-binding protein [Candidatus Thermoplasmatota archaeon]|nr:ABC transporter ATP-binding protein [Candidatus Thermoplasmatota archaeon]
MVPPQATSPGDDAVLFRGVTKKYGAFTALDGLDLTVARGEVYGLLGPNGAGKTTAIKILCGLERATKGEVTVLGHRIPDRGLLPRLGYMPQETALYRDLTVRENLELFGSLYGIEGETFEGRLSEMLRLVSLSGWEDTVVSRLSGGMRHRTSLVAALLHRPELLVLDEPTVGVDPELRENFWGYFRNLAGSGVTILITTHYMDEARNCTRLGLLKRGRLIAEGAPREVMAAAGTDDLEKAFLHFASRTREVGS